MTKIGLGSLSELKGTALATALQQLVVEAQVVAVKAASGVAEQPFDDETITGAHNRAQNTAQYTAQLVPDADITFAIESGIFSVGDRYFDKAIVVARLKSGEFIEAQSDAVEFPQDAVQETIRRGVAVWTCGKVMAEWGRVEKHDDPHLSLTGKSRATFISEAALRVLQKLRERGLL